MSREILLSKNKVAIVDDDDYERLSKFKWYTLYIKEYRLYYAVRHEKIENSTSKNKKSKYRKIRMHKEILAIDYGYNEFVVDHINHNTLDNRKCNLRICKSNENSKNRAPNKNSMFRFKGVTLNKNTNKWKSAIKNNKKLYNLGEYESIIDALIMYDKAALHFHKEFAHTNFKYNLDTYIDDFDEYKIINKPYRKDNKLKIRGVRKENNKYRVGVNRKYCGAFYSKIEAALVYDEIASKTQFKNKTKKLNYPMYI